MDKTFIILLVTGLFATSNSYTYYFIEELMSWSEARHYCLKTYNELLQPEDNIDISMLNNRKYSKAWIGVREYSSWLTWMDESYPRYFNWSATEPSGGMVGLCVLITGVGDWYEHNCSDIKPSVCSNGSHFTLQTEMSWYDAAMHCQDIYAVLVKIPDNTTNAKVRDLLPNGTDAWIGLSRYVYWDATSGYYNPTNWGEGKPNDLSGNAFCAAMMLQNGTWTDESCDVLYPFICRDVDKTKETVLKLEIQTTANLEDPVASSSLIEQLGAMLSKRGVTDFKLTWRKLSIRESDQEGST